MQLYLLSRTWVDNFEEIFFTLISTSPDSYRLLKKRNKSQTWSFCQWIRRKIGVSWQTSMAMIYMITFERFRPSLKIEVCANSSNPYIPRKKAKWILSFGFFARIIFFRKISFWLKCFIIHVGLFNAMLYCAIILRAVNLATQGLRHETKHIFMALTKSQSFRACFNSLTYTHTHTPDHTHVSSLLSVRKTTARWIPLIKASYFDIFYI